MDHTPLLLVPDAFVAENIFLRIGKKDIVKGATLSAEKGCITGLLGRNGSGKSSLLQAVFGTLPAQECDVILNGVKIKKPYAMSGLINYLPQKPFLPPAYTLKKIAEQYKINTDRINQHFPDLEQEFGNKVGQLSLGIERLFSVLVILLAESRFSLLDEPFTHIAPLHIEPLKLLLTEQKQKKGIIITDHLYKHVLDVSDKLYLIRDGQTIFIRERSDLVLHGYLKEYAE